MNRRSLQHPFAWDLDLSGSLQGAGGVGGLLSVYGSTTVNNQSSTHFPCFDGNGNVMALINAADSSQSAQYEYGPFGELIRATGPMARANPFRFSTKFQDNESDLLYYGYRSYNPHIGRWLSRDPIEETGGKNLYAFVLNNPVNTCDRLGKKPIYIPGYGSLHKTKLNVTISPRDPCPNAKIDVVFSFENEDSSITQDSDISQHATFSCDGTATSISAFHTLNNNEGGSWNVVCHAKTRPCPSGKSGNTRLSVSGRLEEGGPIQHAFDVDAYWSYQCDCSCKIRGQVQIGKTLFYYGPL